MRHPLLRIPVPPPPPLPGPEKGEPRKGSVQKVTFKVSLKKLHKGDF